MNNTTTLTRQGYNGRTINIISKIFVAIIVTLLFAISAPTSAFASEGAIITELEPVDAGVEFTLPLNPTRDGVFTLADGPKDVVIVDNTIIGTIDEVGEYLIKTTFTSTGEKPIDMHFPLTVKEATSSDSASETDIEAVAEPEPAKPSTFDWRTIIVIVIIIFVVVLVLGLIRNRRKYRSPRRRKNIEAMSNEIVKTQASAERYQAKLEKAERDVVECAKAIEAELIEEEKRLQKLRDDVAEIMKRGD